MLKYVEYTHVRDKAIYASNACLCMHSCACTQRATRTAFDDEHRGPAGKFHRHSTTQRPERQDGAKNSAGEGQEERRAGIRCISRVGSCWCARTCWLPFS